MTLPLDPGIEPGESEFSWGKGLMPPPSRGYIPKPEEQLHALFRLNKYNKSDPSAELNYDDVVREV